LNEIPNPDYFSIAKCVVYLNQHSLAANLIQQLVKREDSKSLAVAYQIAFDLYENGTQEFLAKVMEALPKEEKDDEANGDAKSEAGENEGLLSDIDTSNVSRTKQSASAEESKVFASVREVLQGTKSIELNLEFLYRNNHADKNILNKIRDSLESRNSIFHSGVTFANAFMNAGTTSDTFFR